MNIWAITHFIIWTKAIEMDNEKFSKHFIKNKRTTDKSGLLVENNQCFLLVVD